MDGYIKIQRIADDLAEHPLLRDISFERIINYTQELIKITGSPELFLEKTAVIPIHNYRGELPCDFISMIQVRGKCGLEYVPTMDNFFTSEEREFGGTSTYKIQGKVIFTSEVNGSVEISYRAIPVDENGWPMLPDNAAFIRAIESYIKMQRFTILFDMGQVSQAVLNNAQQDYAWNIGQAQTEFALPSEDEMETITHVWNNLIPRMTAHKNGFATEHNREYLRRH